MGGRLLRGAAAHSAFPIACASIYVMRRTTVYLRDEQAIQLKRAANKWGRSEAELIRDGVDLILAKTRIDHRSALAFLDEVTAGVYDVAEVGGDEVAKAKTVLDRYADLPLGLTDAVNVVLADNLGTDRILTLDQRHFRAVKPLTSRFS